MLALPAEIPNLIVTLLKEKQQQQQQQQQQTNKNEQNKIKNRLYIAELIAHWAYTVGLSG